MLMLIRIIPCNSRSLGSFVINTPNADTVWLDGSTNSIEWSIGVEDIKIFDIELVRLSSSGIKYVAENGQYRVLALPDFYSPMSIN